MKSVKLKTEYLPALIVTGIAGLFQNGATHCPKSVSFSSRWKEAPGEAG